MRQYFFILLFTLSSHLLCSTTSLTTAILIHKNIIEKEDSQFHTQHKKQNIHYLLAIPPAVIFGGAASGGIIAAGPVMPVIAAGVGIMWIITAIKVKIDSTTKNKSNGNDGSAGSPNPEKDPKKDKNDKEKYPHGEYENNPKHHQNSKKDIGKPPRDGQKALNESRTAPGEKYRVSIEDKKFVIFREHSPGKWHGYVTKNYKDLVQSERNAFYNAGLIRSIKSGKIK